MSDCPLADECPSYSERIEGMGCQHYGHRSGQEWCQHYSQPIRDLKSQPVKPGEDVVVDVEDIHESGAGVGRTEDGFIVLIDGVLPDARATVKIKTVRSNHATAEEIIEKGPIPTDEDEDGGEGGDGEGGDGGDASGGDGDEGSDGDGGDGSDGQSDDDSGGRRSRRERLGSRDNFWGS